MLSNFLATIILIICTNTLPFLVPPVNSKSSSGLYYTIQDGRGHHQTVLKKKFTRQEVHEISLTLLSILGLNHVPKPQLIDPATSMKTPSAQFLRQIFHSSTQNEHGHVHVHVHGHDSNANNIDPNCPKNKMRTKRDVQIEDKFQQNALPLPHLKNLSWSQFNVNENGARAIEMADEIISYVNRGHPFSGQLKEVDEDKQFWFDTPKLYNAEESVLGAELRIWKKTLAGKNFSQITEKYFHISVLQVIRDKIDGDFVLTELDSTDTANWEQGWLRLDVTPAFRLWTTDPNSNFGLVISVKDSETGSEIDLDNSRLAIKLVDSAHEPFLASFLSGAQGLRNKRPTPQSDSTKLLRGHYNNNRVRRSGENRPKVEGKSKRKRQEEEFEAAVDGPRECQMGMLVARFKDMGWSDWVLAPEMFIAYYCHGECSFPLSFQTRATNHAIVASMMNVLYQREHSPPICAPMQLGAIKVLHYDDESNIQLRTFKEMVVRACGCK